MGPLPEIQAGDGEMARRRKRPQTMRALFALLALPLAVWGIVRCAPLLGPLAERAALFSAGMNMPEGSVALIRDRFADELASSESSAPTAPPASQAQPSAPVSSSAPESSSAAEATAQSRPDRIREDPGPLPKPDSVPKKYRGTVEERYYEADGSPLYVPLRAGYLKNSTKLTNKEVAAELKKPLRLKLTQTDEPQVLIIHTHATEAYEEYDVDFYDTRNNWRETDNDYNMVPVGDRIAQELEAAGIGVIHDTTQHDYPSYNGAYERSAQTVRGYLEEYPTIKVVLDVHRDAIQPESTTIVKAVTEVDGERAAQVMIITGCEDGTMGVPNWSQNLRFAAALQSKAEELYPGLMRPIYFCYRKYNMDLTTGSILLEFGSHGNTLQQAEYSGELIGRALAQVLLDTNPDYEPFTG